MEEALFDPFTVEPDPEEQKVILLRALEMAQGFALYFVVCDPGSGRTALIQELVAYFPEKQIQAVPVTSETDNLFHLLQTRLPSPAPDAVFVYGLENWISGAVDPRSLPFIRNLNAARNSFYDLVQSPLVFFVARHVLQAIINGAPDFFSVRSGVYMFPLTPDQRKARAGQSGEIGQDKILALSPITRNDKIAEMEHLLSELRSLDEGQREPKTEAILLNQLGVAYSSLGKYSEAKSFFSEALQILREILRVLSPELAIVLANLAVLCCEEKDYKHAETLFLTSLDVCYRVNDTQILSPANFLNGLGGLYLAQNRFEEAEAKFVEALSTRRDLDTTNPFGLSSNLTNLATLYQKQGHYENAEPLFLEAKQLLIDSLPSNHPSIAISLNNLAVLYSLQGRFVEAGPLYFQASRILRESMGEQHSDTKVAEKNLNEFLAKKTNAARMIEINDKTLRQPKTTVHAPFKWMPMQQRPKKK